MFHAPRARGDICDKCPLKLPPHRHQRCKWRLTATPETAKSALPSRFGVESVANAQGGFRHLRQASYVAGRLGARGGFRRICAAMSS